MKHEGTPRELAPGVVDTQEFTTGLSVRRSQFTCSSWEVSQRPPTDRQGLGKPAAGNAVGFCVRQRCEVLEASPRKLQLPGHMEVPWVGAFSLPRVARSATMAHNRARAILSNVACEPMDSPAPIHVPVMRDEVLAGLEPRAGQVIVDGTLGAGGHTRAIAELVGPRGTVLSLDRDPAALAAAEKNLAGLPVKIAQANYCDLGEVLAEVGIEQVDGILLDIGLSSDQLADETRGFSFDSAGELDLRFDRGEGEPTWQWLERLDSTELANIIFRYGEERHSRRIARAIVERRAEHPLRTARELAEIVRASVPRSPDSRRIDPATRTFQALRIAANDELGSLERALADFPKRLKPGGRLVIISFHSLEDRIVKEAFRDDPRYEVLTRKPVQATEAEVQRNPRARSAKMRAARRTAST